MTTTQIVQGEPMTGIAARNAAAVREMYEALSAGDLERAAACIAEDAVLHVPGRSPNTGDHAGREAIIAFVVHAHELTGGTLRLRLHRVLADDEVAVALTTYTASRPDGRPPLENNLAHVLRMRDGLVAESWFHTRDQYAVDAFWGD
ncbi:nuclear transport factor 2 family protein [Miltoncostaea marina]|uniref:nuclear transport factor 2 family protein n=1 Tax=Miltoncostaea marina TaxID=2843215 RepID=UPI001C3DD8B6|nr:nuclear transport factor 2 family protein [Miltoncostaea marina]